MSSLKFFAMHFLQVEANPVSTDNYPLQLSICPGTLDIEKCTETGSRGNSVTVTWAAEGFVCLPHHRASMVMDHQPLVADTLEQIGGEDTGFDRLVVLAAGEVFGADDPA